MADTWEIHVRLHKGGAEIISPAYTTEDAAKAELAQISTAQKKLSHLDLTWLTVPGNQILSAHIERDVDFLDRLAESGRKTASRKAASD